MPNLVWFLINRVPLSVLADIINLSLTNNLSSNTCQIVNSKSLSCLSESLGKRPWIFTKWHTSHWNGTIKWSLSLSFFKPSKIFVNHCAIVHQKVMQITKQQNWEPIQKRLLKTSFMPGTLAYWSHVIPTAKIRAYDSWQLGYHYAVFYAIDATTQPWGCAKTTSREH